MFDLLIQGGFVIDGTGNPWVRADVGIRKERIAAVGNLKGSRARQVIQATGLVVCPGFIDTHSHSDFTLLVNPRAESKIRQGVTTEIVGNCGLSAAPAGGEAGAYLREVAGFLARRLSFDWVTIGEYFDQLEEQGIAVNVGTFVGHRPLRLAALGFANRKATARELQEMKVLAAQAMEEGALGLSTGLGYAPGVYADTEELIQLARVVAEYGGVYVSHIRDEGDHLIEAVWEAITIGQASDMAVVISHHKATGVRNWGRSRETLRLIEEMRLKSRGVDISFDVYPYNAASTWMSAYLPHWVHAGGREKMLARLQDPRLRPLIRREVEERIFGGYDGIWDRILIAAVASEEKAALTGRSLKEIAQEWGRQPWEVMLDLIVAERDAVSVIIFEVADEDVENLLKHPLATIGSDGSALAISGTLRQGHPHPRSFGTFPRVLGHYVRDKKLLTLEDAIRKMTSLPAQRLKLKDRGIIREGCYADITIFDPDRIRDRATYTEPFQYPEGIEYVVVNGSITLAGGKHTGVLAGKTLRKRDFWERRLHKLYPLTTNW